MEPHARAQNQEPEASRTLFWFGLALVVLLLTVAGVNYLVDPLGHWGSPLGWKPAVLRLERRIILQLSATSDLPDALIIGSSQAGRFEPSYLQHLTGLRSYNAYMTGAQAETMCGIARWVVARERRFPRLLVIAIDVGAFNGPRDNYVTRSPELAPFLPYPVTTATRASLIWESVTLLVSWESLGPSLRSVRRHLAPVRSSPSSGQALETDPAVRDVYNAQNPEDADDETIEPEAYRRRLIASVAWYAPRCAYRRLDPCRVEWLTNLVADACAQGARVILFTVPMHHEVDAALRRRSHYGELLQQALELIHAYEVAYRGVVAVDCSTVDKFGGDDRFFYDGVHPTRGNTRPILDKCVRALAARVGPPGTWRSTMAPHVRPQ